MEVLLGTGRAGVVATSVRRVVPVALPPRFTFLTWAERMSRYLPELEGLSFEAWDALTSQTIDAIDVLNDEEPRPGAHHLAFLTLIRAEGSPALVARHLSWLGDDEGVPVEAGDAPALIQRPEAVVQQMADEGLVLRLR
ncbi:MAG: hypothetical protein JNM69_23475 [Archangium sp.]|nr:hypothetical protein [Archangium sp.]